MSKDRSAVLRRPLYFVCWLALSLVVGSSAAAQEVIANADVTDKTVSQNTLRAIFTMRLRQWPDGKPVKVFVLPDGNTLHVSFAKGVLNTFPYQLKRSWDLQVYSGSGQAPVEVSSVEEMLQKVASTPGAIGYISEDYLTGGKNEHSHVLEVR